MRVLSFDTAGSRGGIAVVADDQTLGAVELGPPGSYAERIMVELDQLLCDLSLEPQDLDLVTVSLGPGSFTGVRIGIAAAMGFAFGIGKPVVGVTSLEVLARWALLVTEGKSPAAAGLIDARRGEVYYAAFDMNPDLEPLIEPGAVRPEHLKAALEPALRRSAPEPLVLCGDGVAVAAPALAQWSEFRKTVFPPLGGEAAALLARLGRRRFERHGAPALLEPLYIRPADARVPSTLRVARPSGGT